MDLSWSDAQQLLKRTARDFMQRELPKEVLVAHQKSDMGYPPQVWSLMADLGWLGMLVPSRFGGSEASFTDAAALFEELGRGPLPSAFFSSSILGVLTLLEAGTEAQAAEVLPALVEGRRVLTVAITEPDYLWGPDGIQITAVPRGDGFVLNGTKLFVSDAVAATHLIVAVRTGANGGDVGLLLVDKQTPGVSCRNLPGLISWQAEVRFDNVEVPRANLLGGREDGGWDALERAMEKALPILCASMVGGCEAVYDMSVSYSRSRVQFGVPIGRFQRVQDHVIRVVNSLDNARWSTYEALWMLDAGLDARASVHLAKAVASESYWEAVNGAHEVHAGIGTAAEYGLTLHTQMSRTLFHYLGEPKWHKRRMADALDW